MRDFSAGDLMAAFDDLAAILSRNGEQGRIYVAGGAAMVLAAGADRTTTFISSAWKTECSRTTGLSTAPKRSRKNDASPTLGSPALSAISASATQEPDGCSARLATAPPTQTGCVAPTTKETPQMSDSSVAVRRLSSVGREVSSCVGASAGSSRCVHERGRTAVLWI